MVERDEHGRNSLLSVHDSAMLVVQLGRVNHVLQVGPGRLVHMRNICGLKCVDACRILLKKAGSARIYDVVRVNWHALLLVLAQQALPARILLFHGRGSRTRLPCCKRLDGAVPALEPRLFVSDVNLL